MSGTLLVATAGQGIMKTGDAGQTWHRLSLGQAIEFDAITRSLDVNLQNPSEIYAGTDTGLCVSHDAGGNWHHVETPFSGETVWKVAVDPNNAQRIFVGTGAPSRAVLWRTTDGCKTWYRAPVEIPEFCAGVHRPRLLAFSYDPTDDNKLWFGLEEGGLFYSDNGGDTFERVDHRLLWDFNSDIHTVNVLANNGHKVVIACCVNAIYRSFDDGQTWEGVNAGKEFGLYYVRATCVPAGSEDTIFISIADGTPGTTSQLLVSRDAGATWQVLPLPMQPNSCIWGIHVNPEDHNQMLMGTKFGYLYTSEKAGLGWKKEWRDFSEIADVLWTPASADIAVAHKSEI